MNLISIKELKCILYKDGEPHFDGFCIMISKNKYKSIRSLIDEINAKISLKNGQVNYLWDLTTSKLLKTIDDISQSSGHILCSTTSILSKNKPIIKSKLVKAPSNSEKRPYKFVTFVRVSKDNIFETLQIHLVTNKYSRMEHIYQHLRLYDNFASVKTIYSTSLKKIISTKEFFASSDIIYIVLDDNRKLPTSDEISLIERKVYSGSSVYESENNKNLPSTLSKYNSHRELTTPSVKRKKSTKNEDRKNISSVRRRLCAPSQLSIMSQKYIESETKTQNIMLKEKKIEIDISSGLETITEKYMGCKLIEKIGDGEFANVYTVLKKNKVYVLKTLNRARSHGNEAQINNEVLIQQELDHHNIIRIYDVFYLDNLPELILMELCEKGDLYDLIQANGAIEENYALNIFLQLMSALAYIHERHVIHRDIKLENIFVTQNIEKKNQIKLGDFGLATKIKSDCSEFLLCGSPLYVSPEMLLEIGYGRPVDMWSAGVMLYALLSSSVPFDVDGEITIHNKADLFRKIRRVEYNFGGYIWECVSEYSKNLISTLLQADPSKRPTANSLCSMNVENHVNKHF